MTERDKLDEAIDEVVAQMVEVGTLVDTGKRVWSERQQNMIAVYRRVTEH